MKSWLSDKSTRYVLCESVLQVTVMFTVLGYAALMCMLHEGVSVWGCSMKKGHGRPMSTTKEEGYGASWGRPVGTRTEQDGDSPDSPFTYVQH